MSIKGFYLALLFSVMLVGQSAHADVSSTSDKALAGANLVGPASVTTDYLDVLFYKALAEINRKNFGEASLRLGELRRYADHFGFANLPDFSKKLLLRVEEGNEATVNEFFLTHALNLSPTHPRTLFQLAGFWDSVGLATAFSHFITGLSNSMQYPSVMMTFAANCLLFSVVALTIAVCTMVVIQLLLRIKDIFYAFAPYFPPILRLVVVPVIIVAAIVLPVLCGILAGVCAWAALLAYCSRECRKLAFVTGVLATLWAVSMPIWEAVSTHIVDGNTRKVEETNASSYFAKYRNHWEEAMAGEPLTPSTMSVYATALWKMQKFDEASVIYRQLSELKGVGNELRTESLTNLGQILLMQGKLNESKSFLLEAEKIGGSSFELYFALSKVNLGLLDTVKHNDYFAKARSLAPERVRAIGSTDFSPSPVTLKPELLYAKFLESPRHLQSVDMEAVEKRRSQLLNSLVLQGTSLSLVLLGVSMFVVTLLFDGKRFRKKARRRDSHSSMGIKVVTPSSLWALIPGGLLTVSGKPIAGILSQAAVFFWLLLAIQGPVEAIPLAAGGKDYSYLLAVFAVVAFMLSGLQLLVKTSRIRLR